MTNENVTLPLLPLTSGVVLPGMVFTMALESDEARAAVDSARSAGGRLLLVPHIEGRFAAVGVIAEVMEEGDLPGGLAAVAIRGDRRAVIGTAVPGTGDALWVEAEPLEEPEPTPAASELAREYRAVMENILHSRGAGRIAAQLREITEPSRLADISGYSPDLSLTQKVEVLETRRRRGAAAPRPRLGPRHPGRRDAAREDQDRRRGGHGEDAARIPAAAPARCHPQGARAAERRRRRRSRRLPGQARVARPARARPQGRRARGRQARAHERPEPRDGLDPHVARHGARDPLGHRVRGPSRHRRGLAHPRGRPRRSGRREGAHPRAPGRAQAAGRARPGAGGRARLGGHPGPRRASRCRQDVARRVRRQRPRAQVRPRLARRGARRGRDPRPPPHLRGGPAGPPGRARCGRPGP